MAKRDVTPNYLDSDAVYAYYQREDAHRAGWLQGHEYGEFIALVQGCLAQGHVPESGKVLGLGCGAGNMMLWCAQQGFDATGVDISPRAIDWAFANTKTIKDTLANEPTFMCTNVLALPLDDASFDFVLDENCFHCIIGKDRKTFLAEAFRVLKPAGQLMIYTMSQPFVDIERDTYNIDYDHEMQCIMRDGFAIRYIAYPAELEHEITEAGFTITRKIRIEVVNEWSTNIIIEALKPART